MLVDAAAIVIGDRIHAVGIVWHCDYCSGLDGGGGRILYEYFLVGKEGMRNGRRFGIGEFIEK